MLKVINTHDGYRIAYFYEDGSWSTETAVPDWFTDKFFPNEEMAEIALKKYSNSSPIGFGMIIAGLVLQVSVAFMLISDYLDRNYLFYIGLFGFLASLFYMFVWDKYRKWKERNN